MARESEVHYNEISEVEGKNELDGPINSNNGRKRAATRNATKNITTSTGTTNEESESDPDDKDYVAQLPKRKPEAGTCRKNKKKTSCDKGKRSMTKENNKNK